MSASPLPWEKYSQSASSPPPWEKYSQKSEPPAPAPNQGLPPGEIPLTSYGAATAQGFANIGKGAIDAVTGMYNTVRHPIDIAKGMLAAPGQLIQQAKQVPGAIRDINQSADPAGTYATVAGKTAGEGAGQAVVAAATPEIPGAVKDAAEAVAKAAKAVGRLTPKQAAQIAGGAGGAVAGHGTLSAPGAYYGAKTGGKIVEGVLGDRANQPIFGKPTEAPVYRDATVDPNNIPEYAGEELPKTAPEALREWWKSRGGGVADRPIDRTTMQKPDPPRSEPLKQPVADVVDSAIPPENKAVNLQVKSKVEFYLQKGDVAGAEKALDSAASKVNPDWPPERPPYAGDTNTIRASLPENVAKRRAELLDDQGIQQQMAQNLEQHGISAESEARREFIARNSTGATKGDLIRQAGGTVPDKPVRYTNTPGIPSKYPRNTPAAPPAGTTVPEGDMTDLLQKSVQQAKAAKPSVKLNLTQDETTRAIPETNPAESERLFELERRERQKANAGYQSTGAMKSANDPIDGEISRLKAEMYGRVGQGESLETVTADTIAKARAAAVKFNAGQNKIWGAAGKKDWRGGPAGFMGPDEAEMRIRHAADMAKPR